MTIWLPAAIGLLLPLAVSAVMALRGGISRRLAAVRFCTTVAAVMLVLLTIAFDPPPSWISGCCSCSRPFPAP